MVAIKLSGSGIAALEKYAAKLKQAEKEARRTILANLGEELVELVHEGFEAEAAPNGEPWKPIQRLPKKRQTWKRDGGKWRKAKKSEAQGVAILQKTGRLRNGWKRRELTDTSVTIAPSVGYAGYHQTGTATMPARKMVPEGTLPARWSATLQEAAEEVLEDLFSE